MQSSFSLARPGEEVLRRRGVIPVYGVVLFQKEPWRQSGLYWDTLKPGPRGDNLSVLKGHLERALRPGAPAASKILSGHWLGSESWLGARRPGLWAGPGH